MRILETLKTHKKNTSQKTELPVTYKPIHINPLTQK